MDVQTLRAEAFKALHEREGAFVIPNPWDAGSAKLLASLGFEALATTSAGLAFSLGRPDAEGALSLDDTLDNAGEIVDATALPVAADLENGFGDLPEDCAQTILRAAEVGLVGGSIEDASGRSDAPIYDFGLAVERVRAAVQAARSLRSRSPCVPGQKTCYTGAWTSTTPSCACKPMPKPVQTCSTPRGCVPWRKSVPWCRQSHRTL
jgi:2-methylisocitrate lyase-like PEP mutase family enzyme